MDRFDNIEACAMRDTTQYLIHGSKYSRLASRKLFNTIGGNLQNKDDSLKRIYFADDGKLLNQRDQAGAEALIVAYLCRDGNYRALFNNGIKVHVFVALHVFAYVWNEEMSKEGLDIQCNIDELLVTDIPSLKNNPWWKSIDSVIKDSDKWEPERRYYYIAKQICHCVDRETEILTKDGWINIDTYYNYYNNNHNKKEIATWSKDKTIKFEIPSHFNCDYISDEMIYFNEPQLNQLTTINHKMIHSDHGKWYETTSEELSKRKESRVPNSGNYVGGEINLPKHDIELLVAIQADGHICASTSVRFRFQNTCKVNTMKRLLKEGNYEYTFRLSDAYEFYVKGIGNLIDLFSGTKVWDSWLLKFSKENLEYLISKVHAWDGYWVDEYCHKREEYNTMIKQNAEWIKTICHLVGKQGTITKAKDGCYSVGINQRTKSRIYNTERVLYNGPVYCPTVSSGYFLIRRRGKISVTGNSGNYGATHYMLALNTLEKSRGRIVLSVKKSKEFLEMYHRLFPEIQDDFQAFVRFTVEETGILYNLFGEPINITGVRHGDQAKSYWKEWYSAIPQNTVAMITRRAVIKMQSFIDDTKVDWDILPGDTHDSFLVQSPENEWEQCQKVMKEFIEPKLTNFKGEEFQMKSEGATGKCWAKYSKDNIDGLKGVEI